MVPRVGEISPVASGTDDVLCPPKEDGDLRYVEWSGAVLEHLWNKTAVHSGGPLVILRRFRSYAV
jgi:hypothetical protein